MSFQLSGISPELDDAVDAFFNEMRAIEQSDDYAILLTEISEYLNNTLIPVRVARKNQKYMKHNSINYCRLLVFWRLIELCSLTAIDYITL